MLQDIIQISKLLQVSKNVLRHFLLQNHITRSLQEANTSKAISIPRTPACIELNMEGEERKWHLHDMQEYFYKGI
jgi:hypothetical protein